MYCRHFNLRKKPFQISSDNEFLWLGPTHAEALNALKQGIKTTGGLMILSGDVGTGKTTLIHEIIHTLNPQTLRAHIPDPSMELHHLFDTIAMDLGFNAPIRRDQKFHPLLLAFLNKAYKTGQKAIIIIDEAHRMPRRFLREILSWSEFGLGPTFTILLAGQLEFHDLLEITIGPQWQTRAGVHALLSPLDEKGTRAYISRRLEKAGSDHPIFSPAAVRRAHHFSKGIPRRINIACDQALVAAYAKDMQTVDAQTFQEAVGIVALPPVPLSTGPQALPLRKNNRPKVLTGVACAVIFGICAYYIALLPIFSPEQAIVPREPDPAAIPIKATPPLSGKPAEDRETAAPFMDILPPPLPLSAGDEPEFYTPPGKGEFPLTRETAPSDLPGQSAHGRPARDPGPAVPQGPPPLEKPAMDMDDFIQEVFMIREKPGRSIPEETAPRPPLPGGQDPPAAAETKSRDKPPAPPGDPDPGAVIDWLFTQKKLGSP